MQFNSTLSRMEMRSILGMEQPYMGEIIMQFIWPLMREVRF